MKKIIIVALGLSILGFAACKKIDGESTDEKAGKIMQSKTWRMTGYYDDGNDRLVNFTGYAFTFNENGTITARKDTLTFEGTYQDTVMSDTTNVASVKFEFSNQRPVNALNKNWEVIKKTTKTVHLRSQDVFNGPYDDIFFRINY